MNFDYKVETLENGLRVVTVPMNVPTVTALAMVGVGSRYEAKGKSGISHFVEHIVFKGTKKYPSPMAIASTVDAVGAQYNAFTSKEFTGFYVKAASAHLGLTLDIVSQFLFAPTLRAEDIARERGVIVEEINMYEDTPVRRVGDLFEELLYRGHELGRDVIGTRETVSSLKRDDFVGHMEQWYKPENMVLGIAGDASKIRNSKFEIRNYFGGRGLQAFDSEPQAQRRGKLALKSLANLSRQNKNRVLVQYKKTEQAHFVLGAESIKRTDKDRYVQAVLTTILGGNMSSRLFNEIREKRGLAYYVRTGSDQFYETGHLATQAGVTIDKINAAIEAVLNEYHNVSKDKNINQKELTKAKDYLKGQFLIELEDSQEVANLFVDSLLLEGKARTPKEVIAGIDTVDIDQVASLARKVFAPEKLHLAVIGPYTDEKEFLRLLS